MYDVLITGGCLCGALRYEAKAAIVAARQCWCKDCQFLACGNASTNIYIHANALHILGDFAEFRSVADSGSHLVRSFCPLCGNQLFSSAGELLDFVAIRAGSLDNPNLAAPEIVIWTESAPNWACFNQSLPSAPNQAATLVAPTRGSAGSDAR